MMKLFLLVAGVFLIPVALSYGVVPAATLPKFMNITVEGTDDTHIFRALMGLYLGMVTAAVSTLNPLAAGGAEARRSCSTRLALPDASFLLREAAAAFSSR